jgi:hypothetical protein
MSKTIMLKPTLKRKVGYIDEEVSITRTKLARMEIAEENIKGDTGPSTTIE